MICTAYKSVSLLIYATIAPSKKIFDTIGCNANHINARRHGPPPTPHPFTFSRNRNRAAVTSTGWLGSATLSGESPLLLCSFVLSNVPALLSLAPGGQQHLNFFCRELLLIFRQMGIKVIPRLRAACPNVPSRLYPTRIV
jgi:hypothetical protein